jgi:hypothetical protein
MNFIKAVALTCAMTWLLAVTSTYAIAEVKVVDPSSTLKETIAHVEQGLAEVKKSDFAAANLHLKAAVESSDQIKGNEAIVKAARANVVQGNIQSKQGEIEKSAVFLNKGLVLYKSL